MAAKTFQLDYKYHNTQRIDSLRKRALEIRPFVCAERAVHYTESYRETEGKDPVTRRALALKNLLEKMTIYINNGELVVGNNSSGPRGSVVAPEYSSNWLARELEDPEKAPDRRKQDWHFISDEVKETLTEDILPYWSGRTVENRVLDLLPDEVIENGIASEGETGTTPVAPECYMRNGIGHVVVDYAQLLNKGFSGIAAEAENMIGQLDLSRPGDIKKRTFYRAVVIIYGAVIGWIKRYSVLAEEQLSECVDEERKRELHRISEDCLYISENPPLTFRQAVQTWFFAQLVMFGLEQNCSAVSPGRFDQYMYPFYKKDLQNGLITEEEAVELIQCLFIKLSEMSILWDFDSASYWSGFSITLGLVAGGVDEDGNDATNELSYLVIEADKNTGLLQPELGVRVHTHSPRKFLFEALKEVRIGRGKPKFFMDNAAISMIRNTDVSLKEARDYSVVGCVELTPSGNTTAYTGAVFVNLAKCLEIAHNDGKCFLTGTRIGPGTGVSDSLTGYEALLNAFKKQISYAVKNAVTVMNVTVESHAELYPCPFTSSLIGGCIESGLDFTEGGAVHKFVGITGVGLPNVANSLAAIKRVVYEQQRMSLQEMVSILIKDFEGSEGLRAELWNDLPKYGNDDDYVDTIAREIGQFYCREVGRYEGSFGIKFRPGLFAVSINVPFGLTTGAGAEGRKAKTPLADGGISPAAGSEKYGVLGVIKSAAKIDNVLASNGTLLNIRFSPSVFEKEEDIMKLVDLLRSYNDLSGYHIQFNVIDSETLRAAQKKPDDYRGLMVRVAGYSAYFVELNPEVQEDIISRTVHESV